MSAKTNAEVVIGGKVYTLSGFESEEYLQKIASYINTKISEANRFSLMVSRKFPKRRNWIPLNI